MGVGDEQPVILGTWKDKEQPPLDPSVAYEDMRKKILASITENKLWIRVGVDNNGKEVLIETGRFLLKEIYDKGISSEDREKLLVEFLPEHDVKADTTEVKESTVPTSIVEAAKRLGGEAVTSTPRKTNTLRTPKFDGFDPWQRAAGEAVVRVRERDAE